MIQYTKRMRLTVKHRSVCSLFRHSLSLIPTTRAEHYAAFAPELLQSAHIYPTTRAEHSQALLQETGHLCRRQVDSLLRRP
uniref:Uncharacterized protein n=1 Tax=Arundo donax TaxID=35708 RepID=A0A0A9CUY3_ARUDO